MYLKTLLILAAASSTVFPAVLSAGDPSKPPVDVQTVLVIPDSEDLQVFNLTGQDVLIKGSRNRVILTGDCGTLTINGDSNRVTAQNVANVVYGGSYNDVKWHNDASSKPGPPNAKEDKQHNITHPGGQM